ncbi:phospholipase D-like domain-containing protein [Winogradskyella flava]|uniref:phospholipase D n=1 Tax=Winogradskyella flava TaxID=1884876 RepID=A0A842IQJ2_9FLAO|nr:phospholipase D-like domain-containing protein [Winogradskyella flava]MBC2845071.1 hypothetical protein [Winogradskyella flava]
MKFEEIKKQLEIHPFVLEARIGFTLKEDWITDEESIVLKVRPELELGQKGLQKLQEYVNESGYKIDIEYATPQDILELEEDSPLDIDLLSRYNKDRENTKSKYGNITYSPPNNVSLEKANDVKSVVCSLSPDNGWGVLQEFILNAKGDLTIGMYDFTAPHILDTLIEKAGDINQLNLVIQEKANVGSGTKANDLKEQELIEKLRKVYKDKFNFAYAHVKGKNRIFGGYYHIKVATNNDLFWLSSGNWQSSNLPDASPTDLSDNSNNINYLKKYNREWHVVVESQKLTDIYQEFLLHDLNESRKKNREIDTDKDYLFEIEREVFVPIDFLLKQIEFTEKGLEYFKPKKIKNTENATIEVMPLLTPDNFYERVSELLKTAQRSIYFQNQALSIKKKGNSEKFMSLLKIMLQKQKEGIDVKIIIRGEFITREQLERIKRFGFDMDSIKLQDRCHNKGIIIDSKIALIGSHNFSNGGTTINRDASLIFYNDEVSNYYKKIFEHDWNHLATRKLRTNKSYNTPRIALPNESTPKNMVRMSWDDFYGEL